MTRSITQEPGMTRCIYCNEDFKEYAPSETTGAKGACPNCGRDLFVEGECRSVFDKVALLEDSHATQSLHKLPTGEK
jgi:predicted RNA-binding Zn-ribbon protein involved in translation (DUF1610 family)